MRVAADLLQEMREAGLVFESTTADAEGETVFQPALSPDKITMDVLATRLDKLGKTPVGLNVSDYESRLPVTMAEAYQLYMEKLNGVAVLDV